MRGRAGEQRGHHSPWHHQSPATVCSNWRCPEQACASPLQRMDFTFHGCQEDSFSGQVLWQRMLALMLHLLSGSDSQACHFRSASSETLRIINAQLSNPLGLTEEERTFQCSKPYSHPHRLLFSSLTFQKNNTTILFPFPCILHLSG